MIRLRSCPASARQALRLASLAQGRPRLRLILATAVIVVLGGGTDLLACPACFGAEEAPLIDAARLGVLVMLGITLAVQGGFVAFFLYLRRRARRAADAEIDTEWSELQGASRT
jgi:heme/copper-type cytochrome/quinol oxidase subunit 2